MTEPVQKDKAFAYITCDRCILLFAHTDYPEAGIQVPAGTMRPGEPVAEAALREAMEETGLTNLALVRVLGVRVFDARPFGRNELHRRTFVHLRCHEETAARWVHWELDPEGSPGERYRFELFWASLDEPLPGLIAGHDAFIDVLRTDLDACSPGRAE